ncbi:MAG: hypothetical protein Q9174_006455 [Haloplaca sp. 1 TL-2023]
MTREVKDVLKAIRTCFETEQFSDLKITCGGREFKCHKVIVCTRSKFFEKACTSGFQESATSHIDLPEDNPVHIEAMLKFLYAMGSRPEIPPIVDFLDFTHAEVKRYLYKEISMYALADKYGIPALCSTAALKVKGCLSRRYDPRELLFCVPLVYGSTPASDRTLRDTIVHYFERLAPSINGRPKTKARLLRLVHTIEEFREDVVLTMLQAVDEGSDEIVRAYGKDVDSEEEVEDSDAMTEAS